eukprot:TRINITY_DN3931_c0_g1_i1.p1 TRINITY_DN3931_c0_g1~~TRINITY_DN3931_c0_g1_i1.p1  ORF type:complete len:1476 (-),score=407.70 TRINITY_DN3931_c0_g1_i1:1071-5498(-)
MKRIYLALFALFSLSFSQNFPPLPIDIPDYIKDYLNNLNNTAKFQHSWNPKNNPFVGPHALNLTNFHNYGIYIDDYNKTTGDVFATHYPKFYSDITYGEQFCEGPTDSSQRLFQKCKDVIEIEAFEIPALSFDASNPFSPPFRYRINDPMESEREWKISEAPEGRRIIALSTSTNTLLLYDFNLDKIVYYLKGDLDISKESKEWDEKAVNRIYSISEAQTGSVALIKVKTKEYIFSLVHYPSFKGLYNGTLEVSDCFTIKSNDEIIQTRVFEEKRTSTQLAITVVNLMKHSKVGDNSFYLIFKEFTLYRDYIPRLNLAVCNEVITGRTEHRWNLMGKVEDLKQLNFELVNQKSCIGNTINASRTIVMIKNSNSVWMFPYNRRNDDERYWSEGRNININLSTENNTKIVEGKSILRHVKAFGECVNSSISQRIWLGLEGGQDNRLSIIPLEPFGQHNFQCDNWNLISGSNCSSVDSGIVNSFNLSTPSQWKERNGTKSFSAFEFNFEKEIDQLEISSTGIPSGNEAKGTLVDHYFYGFSYGNAEIITFGFNKTNGKDLKLERLNTFDIGMSERAKVTPNGQHMFIVHLQARLEVESVNRSLELCRSNGAFLPKLVQDEVDKKYCSNVQPILPKAPFNITRYVSFYTMCSKATHICPSFNLPMTRIIPKGHISNAHLIRVCPAGSVCLDGIQYPCLPGFYCPREATFLPIRCEFNPFYNTTCNEYGLVKPKKCPKGFLCLDPSLPPIAAPPGYYYAIEPEGFKPPTPSTSPDNTQFESFYKRKTRDSMVIYNGKKRDSKAISEGELEREVYSTFSHYFHQCDVGWWCPLASIPTVEPSDSTYPALLCPEGYYCPESSVEHPRECESNSRDYCPAGSDTVKICPDGKSCYNSGQATDCHLGQVCIKGKGNRNCQPGFYCPSPAVEDQCPSGYFCRFNFDRPEKCRATAVCPAGTEKPLDFSVVLIASIISAFVAFWAIYVIKIEPSRKTRGIINLSIPILTHEGISYVPLHRVNKTEGNSESDEEEDFDNDHISESMLTKATSPIDIHIHNVGYNIGKRHILSGVSGSFQHGKLTAIMGPSGCGKSTLLSILSGRISQTEGEILINGAPVMMSKLKTVIGFVPQSEIMLRTLTVRETIYFYARIKTNKGAEYASKLSSEIVDILGLTKSQNTILGDERKRGVSGGELKRASIGIEMVGQPSVLFLDEPTTGLDSTVALQLVTYLKKIAMLDIAVICVIHQPRAEIFHLFDNVLLMGRTGKPGYFGPTRKAKQYFKRLGYNCPPKANVADFLLDVSSGKALRKNLEVQVSNREQEDDSVHVTFKKGGISPSARRKIVTNTFMDTKKRSLGDFWSSLTSDAYSDGFEQIKTNTNQRRQSTSVTSPLSLSPSTTSPPLSASPSKDEMDIFSSQSSSYSSAPSSPPNQNNIPYFEVSEQLNPKEEEAKEKKTIEKRIESGRNGKRHQIFVDSGRNPEIEKRV